MKQEFLKIYHKKSYQSTRKMRSRKKQNFTEINKPIFFFWDRVLLLMCLNRFQKDQSIVIQKDLYLPCLETKQNGKQLSISGRYLSTTGDLTLVNWNFSVRSHHSSVLFYYMRLALLFFSARGNAFVVKIYIPATCGGVLLRYNWHMTLYEFKVYSRMADICVYCEMITIR